MDQVKSNTRRGRASFIMAIVGVSLVLIILGCLGWLGINYSQLSDYFRESVPVQVFIRETTSEAEKDALVKQVSELPYIKSYVYKDKETARKEWLSMEEELAAR